MAGIVQNDFVFKLEKNMQFLICDICHCLVRYSTCRFSFKVINFSVSKNAVFGVYKIC